MLNYSLALTTIKWHLWQYVDKRVRSWGHSHTWKSSMKIKSILMRLQRKDEFICIYLCDRFLLNHITSLSEHSWEFFLSCFLDVFDMNDLVICVDSQLVCLEWVLHWVRCSEDIVKLFECSLLRLRKEEVPNRLLNGIPNHEHNVGLPADLLEWDRPLEICC